jgi:hypothetical protein
MVADGTYVATVDRVEGELAVVLVEEDGDVIGEVTQPLGDLPPGVEPGSVLEIRLDDGDLVEVTEDPEETRARKENARNRFDKLSRRPDETE